MSQAPHPHIDPDMHTQWSESPTVLWGFLQPCSAALARIDLWRINPTYTFGRNTEFNQVVLPGPHISECCCFLYASRRDSRPLRAVDGIANPLPR
jgi:ser/thr/tyr protein kinase RAD53